MSKSQSTKSNSICSSLQFTRHSRICWTKCDKRSSLHWLWFALISLWAMWTSWHLVKFAFWPNPPVENWFPLNLSVQRTQTTVLSSVNKKWPPSNNLCFLLWQLVVMAPSTNKYRSSGPILFIHHNSLSMWVTLSAGSRRWCASAADNDAHHRWLPADKVRWQARGSSWGLTTMPSIGFWIRRRKHSRNEMNWSGYVNPPSFWRLSNDPRWIT